MAAPIDPVPTTPTVGQSIAGILEKVFWTFIQTLIGYLLLQSVFDIDSGKAAALAGIAAGINTLIAMSPVSIGLHPIVDLLYRAVRTFGIAFITPLIASGLLDIDFAAWKAAAVAALPALLSVLKSYAATKLGDHNTAATLPARLDPTTTIVPDPVHV